MPLGAFDIGLDEVYPGKVQFADHVINRYRLLGISLIPNLSYQRKATTLS